ncbi:MAG: FHA domain-containing protein [Spirochaetales bacterium]|nr:FHA domain-containing protein [Spirochaetales bacterium]
MEEDTLDAESNLGKRLKHIRKTEKRYLRFKGNTIPVIAEITIGRDKGNSIVIDDTMVSRYHAVIHKIKDFYFIKDLESTNGTRVNGILVPKDKHVQLKPGDIIHIGRTDFSFI